MQVYSYKKRFINESHERYNGEIETLQLLKLIYEKDGVIQTDILDSRIVGDENIIERGSFDIPDGYTILGIADKEESLSDVTVIGYDFK